MPDSLAPVAPQPAPTAQTSGESSKSVGKANATVQQFAQRFLQKDAAPAAQPEATAEPDKQAQAAATPPADAPAETEPVAAADKTTEATDDGTNEADDALSKSTSQQVEFTPEQQELFNKRLGKEIAKRKEAEQQAKETSAKLNELLLKSNEQSAPKTEAEITPQIVPLPIGSPILANIPDINGLVVLQKQAQEAIRWAEQQLERDDYDRDPAVDPASKRPYSREDLRSVKWNARTTLEDHIPQRAAFLQQQNQSQQIAFEKFPFLKDKASAQYLEAQQILKANPWLRSIPTGDFAVGAIVRGMAALKADEESAAKNKTAKAPAPKPKPAGDGQSAVSTGATSDRVPISTVNRAAIQEIDAKLTKRGGVSAKDYAAALAAKSNIRNLR